METDVAFQLPTDSNAVPVIVTVLPPLVGPIAGFTFVTEGIATYEYWSLLLIALVPPTASTVMSRALAGLCAGTRTVSWVALFTVKHGDAPHTVFTSAVSTNTSVTPVKLVPVTTTEVPPAVGPAAGTTFVTVGAATNVYLSPAEIALSPPTVSTLTSTGDPGACAGRSTVIVVGFTTV